MQTVKAKSVGMSRKRLKRVGNMLQRHIDAGKLAGSIALLAREGEVVYHKCQGSMDVEANKAMQPDALFRIFSMSKPITSVALLMLYEQGYFHLTDPVSRFIPEFADIKVFAGEGEDGLITEDLASPVTIHQLLTHTSGLCYGIDAGSPNPIDRLYKEQVLIRTDETLPDKVKRMVNIPLLFQPGTQWYYSMATDILGYIVQIVSGMDFDTYMKREIFEPLGMVDTDFYVPKTKQSRFSECYAWNEKQELVNIAGTDRFDKANEWLYMRERPAFLSGGGGLVSTTADYLRFAMMLRNRGALDGERILGSKMVELMTMNHLLPGQPVFDATNRGFGLGVGVTLDVAQSKGLGSVGTYGWGGAASTNYWYDPQEDLIGILMVQLMQPHTSSVQADFNTMAYQAIVD